MKKIICLILIFTLLLSLSLSASAVGNTYTFTSSWWKLIFDNLVLSNNNNDKTYNTYNGALSLDGVLYNSDYDYSSSAIWLQCDGSVSSGLLTVTIPLNLTLGAGIDTLSLDFYSSYSNSVKPLSATFHSGNSNYTSTITTHDIDSVAFGSLNFPSSSATIANFSAEYTGRGQLINLFYAKPNTTTLPLVIDSVSIIFQSSGSTFCLGVPCIDRLVTLPDHLYNDIANIKYISRQIYSYFGLLNGYVVQLQQQISDLTDLLSDSGGSTENYYNTIINQSPEQAALVAQLQSELAAAKEELAEIQEVITSVPAPTADNIFNTNTSTTSEDYISDALSDNTVLDLFTYFFNNSFVIMAFGVTITIATVSYILYGKKG